MLLGALAFIALFVFAIGFHEFGHYITARWAGIKVSKFFIGFGPTLWSTRRGAMERVLVTHGGGEQVVERPETEVGIKLLPLGGFVRVLGMSPFEHLEPEELPRSFRAAPAYKRVIVLAAGSATHFITAFFVLFMIFSVVGIPDETAPLPVVDGISREVAGKPAPALQAGIKPGDRIVAVDGRPVRSWNDVKTAIASNPRRAISVRLRPRSGAERTVTITPAADRDEKGQIIGRIGILPAVRTTRLGPFAGLSRSASLMAEISKSFAGAAPKAFAPRNLGIVPGSKPGQDRALSIYGAGWIAASLAATGQVAIFLFFYAQLNVFVGIFNMLPLPPLDGGNLLLVIVEKIRGKPVEGRVLLPIMAVVTSLLIFLGLSLLFQDIFSPIRSPFQ
jgi:membrane-associated protease RseP (regulator of RpoE activity)